MPQASCFYYKGHTMQYYAKFWVFLLFIMSFLTHGASGLASRPDVRHFIDDMVKQHHFSRQYLAQVMNTAQIQPQIIVSMDKPYEKKTWDVYKAIFLTPQRLQAGLTYWRANRRALEKAQARYHVDASVIVAIIGVETLYGERQGTYRVLDALTTLAFNYPKRAPYFKKELVEYLLLCREHGVHPAKYTGSYAGAMGVPQFMPSSYRHFAANFTGHPKKDLMRDHDAVIASVANYFHHHGWKMQQAVVVPAKIAGSQLSRINTNYKQPMYHAYQLAQAGVSPVSSILHAPQTMGLIALETQKGYEYWIAYPDFYVITRYNSSPLYAMAVYLLAQQLQQKMAA